MRFKFSKITDHIEGIGKKISDADLALGMPNNPEHVDMLNMHVYLQILRQLERINDNLVGIDTRLQELKKSK